MNRAKTIISTLVAIAVLAAALAIPAYAVTHNTSEAKAVHKLVNAERQKAGLNTLVWDEDLAEAAVIRVEEITRKYTADHSRPDGSTFFSVSTKVWGENAAYGQLDADEVMTTWMNSKGHKANILRDNYTAIGVGCARGDDGVLYWIQLFGTGKSNASWAGVKSYTLDPFAAGTGETAAAGQNASASVMDADGVVNAAGLAAAVKNAPGATVTLKNAKSISPAAFGAAAGASDKTVVQVDTMSANGKTVQGSMLLEPAKVAGRKTAIRPGVYTSSASVSDLRELAEKRYGNTTMVYIHMEHSGTLSTTTAIKARVKLDGLNTDNLQLYVYDKKADTFTLLPNAQPAYDSGVLSFATKTAGDIIITDTKLR